jgi:hypothetical protein
MSYSGQACRCLLMVLLIGSLSSAVVAGPVTFIDATQQVGASLGYRSQGSEFIGAEDFDPDAPWGLADADLGVSIGAYGNSGRAALVSVIGESEFTADGAVGV